MLQHDSMPDSPTPKSPASSPPPTSPSSDDVERCVYPSKFCPNPRATKMNGERHKFCEFHRRKANLNQRRWQQRRQRQRKDHLVALTPSRSVNEHGVSGGAYSDDDAAHPQSPDVHHRHLHHHQHPLAHAHPQLHHPQHVHHEYSPPHGQWRHPLHAPLTSHLPERHHHFLPHTFSRAPHSPPRSASFPPSKGFLPPFGLNSMSSRQLPPPPLAPLQTSASVNHDIPPFPSSIEHPHRLARSLSSSSSSPTRMHPYAPSPLRPSLKVEPGQRQQPQVLPRLPALAHVVQGAASASASASVRQLPATIGVSASPEEVTSSTKQFMF
ncbi:hypothetical protein ATCC90586_011742 [Pythium insidiosum]|nr:hypothetical protein ATCC90586_011742 [Pythium insidiosum]